MFPRVITTKRNGQIYRYLAIIESYREDGKNKQRQVGHVGNIDRYSEEEIKRLINKLREFLHDDPYGTAEDITTYGTKHYGIPYVVNFFWDQFGLTEFIRSSLKDRQLEFDVALCTKIMVLNRLIAPQSKLALTRWIPDLYLEELEGTPQPELHHFYRTLDCLVEIKDALEKYLYHQLTDLLSLRLTLVFYDLTSSYFEGTHCPLAAYGYSRDKRPDRLQINLGLLVTPEGIPIAHEVFPGNVADKSTVAKTIAVLKERFNIGECVFVGDRGMVSNDNLLALREAEFRYILGFHKRGRLVSDELLAKHQDLALYSQSKTGSLFYKEIAAADVPEGEDEDKSDPEVRYILCHNPAKAEDDRIFREEALREAEEKLAALKAQLADETTRRGRKITPKGVVVKLASILEHKGMTPFFDVSYDGQKELSFQRNEAAIAKEALRDGKFLVKTNSNLEPEAIVAAYKNLQQVESAFHEIKDFIRLRPIYHYNETRVRGHVMICVLAYLFEQWLEVLHRRQIEAEIYQASRQSTILPEAKCEELKASHLSGRRILEELDKIKAVDQEFANQRLYNITLPRPSQRKILERLEVPPPPKVLCRNNT
ncbi:MAG: IS1634 family transposase [Syntrophothermus sp.]|uniref:IS1634 family transposase n=1 Tax=Syntrophothermus sp. TaxID=2736299 RepID=UPI0025809C8A|nr:IS1634 family transposase [Syntrophothermus sp.]NSW83678.1 IS1634 family transposase [Syntrophothermus sp.]